MVLLGDHFGLINVHDLLGVNMFHFEPARRQIISSLIVWWGEAAQDEEDPCALITWETWFSRSNALFDPAWTDVSAFLWPTTVNQANPTPCHSFCNHLQAISCESEYCGESSFVVFPTQYCVDSINTMWETQVCMKRVRRDRDWGGGKDMDEIEADL
jgi:hypothetical protein